MNILEEFYKQNIKLAEKKQIVVNYGTMLTIYDGYVAISIHENKIYITRDHNKQASGLYILINSMLPNLIDTDLKIQNSVSTALLKKILEKIKEYFESKTHSSEYTKGKQKLKLFYGSY